jgi:hypothetical protein
MSVRRQCPACGVGVGVARSVSSIPGQPFAIVTLVCQPCQHEWRVKIDSTQGERTTGSPDKTE